jgi:MinD-like ATPase involved in chromosome partitioning or flagellar assembly/tetratricopeptide (TPR) repeat protein
MKPFWTTFYSYKGGVGRSLALANIAALLVRRGRCVVLIDFDLEAPGLDSFTEFRSVGGKPGVLEYVTEFKETNRAPDITRFVHPCELPGPLRGQLYIMPAGKKDAHYNACRANLSWADLYENHHGEQFVENWKAALENHYHPDHVFVDSRTGLTEVGGICTLHLPDLVVMLFGLNEQNVKGIAAVAKTIRESEITRVPQIHYVVSPLPNMPRDKGGSLDKRWAEASTDLGIKIESSLRYQPFAALSERLFVLDPLLDDNVLIQNYRDLLHRLIEYNRNGLDFLIRQAKTAVAEGDVPDRLFTILQEEYPDRPEALMARATLRQAAGDYATATALARQTLELDPAFTEAFDWLIKQYKKEAKFPAALSLCDSVLASAKRLDPETLSSIHQQRGEVAMAASHYEEAGYSFAFNLSRESESDTPNPTNLLIHSFNRAESLRRLVREPRPEVWRPIVDLFDKSGETASAPLIWQANRFQAIHIPLAMVGELRRAREALNKARLAAELLGLAEDIFTVKTYTNVPVRDFIAINDEMLAALDKGQLWDGMPLPPAQTEKPPVPKLPNTAA